MARCNIKVNCEKLEIILKQRGLNINDICEELGYNRNYSGHIRNTGRVTSAFTKSLSVLYNIPYELYAVEEEKETPTEPTTIDYDKLGEIINKAVYEAVKKAWSE